MSKNKFQHIIPKTFLRSWSHNQNSVWVYNKTKKIYSELNINNSIFGQNYTYNLTLRELSLMNNEERDKIIDTFIKYSFFDKNGDNVDISNVIKNIDLIGSLDVYTNGRKISKQEKNRLKNISFQRIDLLFQEIENKWPEKLNKFISICDINKRYNSISKKDYEDLVFFAKSLYSRNPEIVEKHIQYTKENHPDLKITEDINRQLFLSIQIDLFKKESGRCLLQLDKLSPCFIVAAQESSFICPYNCAQYNFTNFEVKNGNSIIHLDCRAWIPLSPKLLLLFVTNGKELENQNVLYYDNVNVEQLNEDLIRLSEKFFISKDEIFKTEYTKSKSID